MKPMPVIKLGHQCHGASNVATSCTLFTQATHQNQIHSYELKATLFELTVVITL